VFGVDPSFVRLGDDRQVRQVPHPSTRATLPT
jgi:hypothetical protein